MKDNEWKKRNCRGQMWSELVRNIREAWLNEGRIGETLGEIRRELVGTEESRENGCGGASKKVDGSRRTANKVGGAIEKCCLEKTTQRRNVNIMGNNERKWSK